MKVEPLCKMGKTQFSHSWTMSAAVSWSSTGKYCTNMACLVARMGHLREAAHDCDYKLKGFFSNKTWLIAAPSVVTTKNQYFPDNDERMSVHCLESGCIGKYTPLDPRDFPQAGILHPSALEIALGQSLRPRGAKSPPSGNLSGLGGCIFRYIPPLVSVRTHYDDISADVLIQF